MRREDLFNAIGMVDDKHLARCEKHMNPSEVTRKEDSKMKNSGKYTAKSKHNGMPKVWLIAAIIGTMVFLMGCAWIVLRMQDLNLGQNEVTYDAFDYDTMEYVGKETYTEEVFTVTGLRGSPEYKAALEWFEFLQSYDTDRSIQGAVWGNYPEFPEEYSTYNLYSKEMTLGPKKH